MSILKHKKALLDFCSIDHWENVCAFTFNLKQAVRVEQKGSKNNTFQWYRLDDMRSRKCFKEFMRALNRRVYKSAYVRHGKRLQTIAILEKSVEGRYHFHAAIESPKHMAQELFCKLAMDVHAGTSPTDGYGRSVLLCSREVFWSCLCLMPPLWPIVRTAPIPKVQEKTDSFWY
jgi:hypothetical protein